MSKNNKTKDTSNNELNDEKSLAQLTTQMETQMEEDLDSEASLVEYEDKILDINLKKPKTAFNCYIMEMREKDNDAYITNTTEKYSPIWKTMTTQEKEKYHVLAAQDKIRYYEHTAFARKHILKKPVKENATARTIFIDEYITDKLEAGIDPKDARKEGAAVWKNMSINQKKVYEEKKEQNKELYDDIKKAKTSQISAYTLYCRDKFRKAKDKGDKLTLKDIAEDWNKVKDSVKEKYEKYAEEEREKRVKNRDLYEMVFHIKPKVPRSSFGFYLMELSKNKAFTTMTEASDGFQMLELEEKERFEKIAKKAKLSYTIKQADYINTFRKKTNIRSKTAFNIFVKEESEKKEYPSNLPKGGYFSWCHQKWKTTDDATKLKYQEIANKINQKNNEKKYERWNEANKCLDAPKKPASGYNRYMRDRISELQDREENRPITEIFKEVAKEWKDIKPNLKGDYDRLFQEDLVEYKTQMREFEKKKKEFLKDKKPESTKKGKK
jgi:hypothetical protein